MGAQMVPHACSCRCRCALNPDPAGLEHSAQPPDRYASTFAVACAASAATSASAFAQQVCILLPHRALTVTICWSNAE